MPSISLPLLDGIDALPVPYQGHTQASRTASATGAVCASRQRRAKAQRLLNAIREHGPVTMHRCAGLTGLPLSSVCSLMAVIRKDIEAAGHETISRPGGRDTKRTLWRPKR